MGEEKRGCVGFIGNKHRNSPARDWENMIVRIKATTNQGFFNSRFYQNDAPLAERSYRV